MKKSTKFIMTIVYGSIFLILGIAIMIFTDGLRRWYSGGFFLFLGILTIINLIVRNRSKEN